MQEDPPIFVSLKALKKRFDPTHVGHLIHLKECSLKHTPILLVRVGPLDDSLLEVSNVTYATTSNEPGTPGKETWTFDPVGAGNTQIKLELVRPWEKDVPPADQKTFNVTVSEASGSSSE